MSATPSAEITPRATIRVRRAPASDPPYDDERDPDTWGIPLQPPLALEPSPSGPALAEPLAPRAGTSASPPPARTTATRFLNACLEIVNGLRPVGHLRELTHPLEAAAVLSAMTHATRRLRREARHGAGQRERLIKLRRMRTCQPRPGVIEIAAVIGLGDRVWAAAFRLERRHGRWRCTAATVL